jgi:hypothetical protein
LQARTARGETNLKEGGNAKFTQVTFHLTQLKRAQSSRTTPTIQGNVSAETATSLRHDAPLFEEETLGA